MGLLDFAGIRDEAFQEDAYYIREYDNYVNVLTNRTLKALESFLEIAIGMQRL